jgi:hypothetical protein
MPVAYQHLFDACEKSLQQKIKEHPRFEQFHDKPVEFLEVLDELVQSPQGNKY